VNFRTKLSAVASVAEFRFRVDGGNRLQNRVSVTRVRRFALAAKKCGSEQPKRSE